MKFALLLAFAACTVLATMPLEGSSPWYDASTETSCDDDMLTTQTAAAAATNTSPPNPKDLSTTTILSVHNSWTEVTFSPVSPASVEESTMPKSSGTSPPNSNALSSTKFPSVHNSWTDTSFSPQSPASDVESSMPRSSGTSPTAASMITTPLTDITQDAEHMHTATGDEVVTLEVLATLSPTTDLSSNLTTAMTASHVSVYHSSVSHIKVPSSTNALAGKECPHTHEGSQHPHTSQGSQHAPEHKTVTEKVTMTEHVTVAKTVTVDFDTVISTSTRTSIHQSASHSTIHTGMPSNTLAAAGTDAHGHTTSSEKPKSLGSAPTHSSSTSSVSKSTTSHSSTISNTSVPFVASTQEVKDAERLHPNQHPTVNPPAFTPHTQSPPAASDMSFFTFPNKPPAGASSTSSTTATGPIPTPVGDKAVMSPSETYPPSPSPFARGSWSAWTSSMVSMLVGGSASGVSAQATGSSLSSGMGWNTTTVTHNSDATHTVALSSSPSFTAQGMDKAVVNTSPVTAAPVTKTPVSQPSTGTGCTLTMKQKPTFCGCITTHYASTTISTMPCNGCQVAQVTEAIYDKAYVRFHGEKYVCPPGKHWSTTLPLTTQTVCASTQPNNLATPTPQTITSITTMTSAMAVSSTPSSGFVTSPLARRDTTASPLRTVVHDTSLHTLFAYNCTLTFKNHPTDMACLHTAYETTVSETTDCWGCTTTLRRNKYMEPWTREMGQEIVSCSKTWSTTLPTTTTTLCSPSYGAPTPHTLKWLLWPVTIVTLEPVTAPRTSTPAA